MCAHLSQPTRFLFLIFNRLRNEQSFVFAFIWLQLNPKESGGGFNLVLISSLGAIKTGKLERVCRLLISAVYASCMLSSRRQTLSSLPERQRWSPSLCAWELLPLGSSRTCLGAQGVVQLLSVWRILWTSLNVSAEVLQHWQFRLQI